MTERNSMTYPGSNFGILPAIPVENLREELLAAVLAYGDAVYDPAVGLLREWSNPNPIHTRIGDTYAHRYVPSGYYALALLEAGRIADAEVVLTALVSGQDVDVDSATYGLWGYFAEEPVAAMVPPDWNQADFNGRTLAVALLRHGARLSGDVMERARSAVKHASASIRRRDVHLDYTNIAVKGTFVTAAAGQLLGDPEMASYAADRLRRFAERIDRTGTFAEFASPIYWLVAAEGLQAMAELLMPDDGLLAQVRHRHWQHLAVRWNAGIGQIAGPMSRAYADDVTLLPALAAYLALAVTEAAGGPVPGHEEVVLPEVDAPLVWPVLLHPRVPKGMLGYFTSASTCQHRELVVLPDPDTAREQAGSSALAEQVATTWLTPRLSLGSINQSDTWLQRRVLLGQWAPGGSKGPGGSSTSGTLRTRVLRDGEDVSAGSFSSVQDGGRVLWAAGLALPGGDRHIHLDMLPAGESIPAERLSVAFDVSAGQTAWFADGEPLPDDSTVPPRAAVQMIAGHVVIEVRVAAVSMGCQVRRDGERLEVVLRTGPGQIDVTGPLIAVGTLRMRELADLSGWDSVPKRGVPTPAPDEPPQITWTATTLSARWPGTAEEPDLGLTVRSVVGSRTEHAQAFRSTIGGASVPAPRLSEDLLGTCDQTTSEKAIDRPEEK